MAWERRWHPLREEWVTITSHRNSRPWSGSDEIEFSGTEKSYDANCYLCPGNTRISGKKNPDYSDIYVFDNDHPSYSTPPPDIQETDNDVFRVEPAGGICRVICYSPDHNGSLARMSASGTRRLVDTWADQTLDLIGRDRKSVV